MSKPLPVVFVWHFHQPCYLDYATGIYRMPWVRLHAIKDYYGFALTLSRFPEIKATFNLTPVLVAQILDILKRRASDKFLDLSYRSADTLDSEEQLFLLRDFFSLNWETMVPLFPRYQQLLVKRGRTASGAELEERVRDFSVSEWRDLQVLFNLAWFHPTLRQEEGLLKDLVRKGRNYTEEEKTALLDFQYEIMARIIPLWKRMSGEGQIEISTSPYYHPILPLLLSGPQPLPEDAALQVRMAREFCRDIFGSEPAGCWPSEGAVSNETLNLLTREGFLWTATDEGILRRSWDGGELPADGIYQPYAYQGDAGQIKVIFRDQHISDKIGFAYQFQEAKAAAENLCADLSRVKRLLGDGPGAVHIILDGENAWESYPVNGVPFLTTLYATLSARKEFKTYTASQSLSETRTLPLNRIHTGSWINQDLHIWSGYPAADFAWQAVARARQARRIEEFGEPARSSVLAAEGSDWFWWLSPEHCSGRDQEFDDLFRLFLINFYRFQGEKEPEDLQNFTKELQAEKVRLPKNPIQPEIDGRVTSYYEWLGAGHLTEGALSGAMHQQQRVVVTDFYFGWDRNNLYLRCDLDPVCVEEDGFLFCLNFGLAGQWSFRAGNGKIISQSFLFPVAQETIIEVAFPWQELKLVSGSGLEFFFEVRRDNHILQRFPHQKSLNLTVPGDDYEENFW
ncbi:MAG: glycoside hydrolase family 57 protein [Candidatus Omnitrophica bacterium]|nr:glycoside hydrolase family 57 protein [Candidatus Omnitrophota bacterium]